MGIKLTYEIFVEKSRKIHGFLYNYSKVDYINNSTKVIIICLRCNGEFLQAPDKHLYGQGCRKCNHKKGCKNFAHTQEKFIKIAKKIHKNKWDYSKINYKNYLTKVCIICQIHGKFWQTPSNHISKHNKNGCPQCAKENKELRGFGYTLPYFKKYPNKNGILYLITMEKDKETFLKIGITKNSIKERYKKIKNYTIVNEIFWKMKLKKAWNLERKIKKCFKNVKYIPKLKFGGGETECFEYKYSREIEDFIKELVV